MSTSLFAHLATLFSTHPENLATEALGYILQQSRTARDAFRQLLSDTLGPGFDLGWSTQAIGADQARPDLVGTSPTGEKAVVVEVKFWAGLTDNQPVAYFGHVAEGGVLVFVAPEQRCTLLWHELARRITDADLKAEFDGLRPNELKVGSKTLVLVSWRQVLAAMLARCEAEGDHGAKEDIAQLLALCDRMDSEAFLPLTSEELSGSVPRRIVQYGALVDDAVGSLVERGVASTTGCGSTAGNGWYGRYMFLRGVPALLAADFRLWGKYASTPLWLSFYREGWRVKDPRPLFEALASLSAENPPRLFKTVDGFPAVPIFLPTGVEREKVLGKVIDQVMSPARLVEGLATEGAGEVPVVPEEQVAEEGC